MPGTRTVINYGKEHNTYGGHIFESDFCTDYQGIQKRYSQFANRIYKDMRFDIQCLRNAKSRDKYGVRNFN